MTNKIDKFFGEYRWLSNFHLCDIEYEGIVYPSTEHAYQAAKVSDPEIRKQCLGMSCKEVKRWGRTLREDLDYLDKTKNIHLNRTLPADWDTGPILEQKRVRVMWDVCWYKFNKHADLKEKLLATGDAELIEGNSWGDKFWGVCNGGENMLGKILMQIREDIRNDG